jgi:hypothetical protein
MMLGLAACTPAAGGDAAAGGEPSLPVLSDGYENALSAQGQLALGIVQLDETELAVDEVQAAELLPLWQALQSLQNSDTAAEAEINAVISQIQEGMAPEQIQAIVDMALTTDSLTALAEGGDLAFGFRGQAGNVDSGLTGEGFPGGFPGAGPGGGSGGGPGGFFPGGGFSGGPAGAGNLSQDDLATRQAVRASGDFGGFQEQILSNIVIQMLANKSGAQLDLPRGNVAPVIFTAAAEAAGLSGEEIRAQMAEGATLAEVITANGGDVVAVRAAIIAALNGLPDAADLDVEQIADDWLGQQ